VSQRSVVAMKEISTARIDHEEQLSSPWAISTPMSCDAFMQHQLLLLTTTVQTGSPTLYSTIQDEVDDAC
jgi:hypothetical protein